MILCDVGVLLHAMIQRSPQSRELPSGARTAPLTPQEMALSELVLAAVVRIGTNPRVYRPCPTTDEVLGFVDALRSQPEARRISSGPRHRTIFRDLVQATGLRGSDTTDAYLAALALEHGCEGWTTNRDFARFPGLHWRNLIA